MKHSKHSKSENFARYLLTVILLSLLFKALRSFGGAPLYSDEPPPAISGPGSTDSAGKPRPGDPRRASLTLKERQMMGVPAHTASKQDALNHLAVAVNYRKERIAAVDVLYTNVETSIASTRLSGKAVWDGLQSFRNEPTRVSPVSLAAVIPNVTLPNSFPSSPVGSDPSSTRAGFRDLRLPALGAIQNANASVATKGFQDTVVAMAKNPDIAVAVTINNVAGAVLRPIVNGLTKVGDEMMRTLDCAASGSAAESSCATPTTTQDYWSSIMTGNASGYKMEAVVLDAIGFLPVGKIAGAVAADATQAVFKATVESLEKMSGTIAKGAVGIEASAARLGFGSEAGSLLINEGKVAVETAEAGVTTARTVSKVVDEMGEKFQEILKMPKGTRPDPKTYLSQPYIDAHLKEFESGASFFILEENLVTFGRDFIGYPDNTRFVFPSSKVDAILKATGKDISKMESALGIPSGEWQGKLLVRIDVPNPKGLNLRFPSGNEAGAGKQFLPGGYLPSGFPEAVIDKVPKGQYVERGL
jgi:hypothetical protein